MAQRRREREEARLKRREEVKQPSNRPRLRPRPVNEEAKQPNGNSEQSEELKTPTRDIRRQAQVDLNLTSL